MPHLCHGFLRFPSESLWQPEYLLQARKLQVRDDLKCAKALHVLQIARHM